MRSIGYPVFTYKLGAFVLAGALAGLSGYLAACQFGFVNPEILAWHQSGIVLMMVILGGMGRLHGAVLGAFAYVFLQEIFSASALLGAYAKHWQLAMGTLIVVIVVALPHGVGGFVDIFLRSAVRRHGDVAGELMTKRSYKSKNSAKLSAALPPSTESRSKSEAPSCTRSSAPTAPAKRP